MLWLAIAARPCQGRAENFADQGRAAGRPEAFLPIISPFRGSHAALYSDRPQ